MLQARHQPADGALLQPEQLPQLLLRHRLDIGQLPQRHHLRQRHVQSGVVVRVRLQEAAEPHQTPQRSA